MYDGNHTYTHGYTVNTNTKSTIGRLPEGSSGLYRHGNTLRHSDSADLALGRIHSAIEALFGKPMHDLRLLAPQERLSLLEAKSPRSRRRESFLSYAMLLREEGLCQLLRGSQMNAMESFLHSMDVFVHVTRSTE